MHAPITPLYATHIGPEKGSARVKFVSRGPSLSGTPSETRNPPAAEPTWSFRGWLPSPVIGAASSEQFGTLHASVHFATSSVMVLLSRIDAANLSLELVHPWGWIAQRLRYPTLANFTRVYRGWCPRLVEPPGE